MFTHYLIAATRQLRRNKATTAANVACLVLGLTCFIVAWGVAAYFGETDGYQANAPRLHVVIMTDDSSDAPSIPVGPVLLAERLAADFPQLEAVARAALPREVPVVVDDGRYFANAVYVDPAFLTLFDLPMVDAAIPDRTALLSSPGSALVSRSLATRLFGNEQVVGRTLRLGGGKESTENVTITGVLDNIRQPSLMTTDPAGTAMPFGLQFDLLASMDMDPAQYLPQRWNSRGYFTYVLLPRDGSLTAQGLDDQLQGFARRHVPTDGSEGDLRFHTHPVTRITQMALDTLVGTSSTGVSSTVVLSILGGLVLLVACFNYANLATAQYVARGREISVRRVLGAKSFHVIAQHVTEGVLLTGAAVLVALVFIAAILSTVGSDVLYSIVRTFAPMPQFWLFLAAVIVAVGVFASAYPAFVLCRVRPADAQRGGRSRGGSRFFTNLFVGLQFAFGAFLLVSVFVIIAQNTALDRAVARPGSDPVVVIANDLRDANVDPQLLTTALSGQAGITGVGRMGAAPWGTNFRFAELTQTSDASARPFRASQHIVDPEAFAALDIRLLAGRTFEAQRGEDTANVQAWGDSDSGAAPDFNIVVERALAESLGFESPEEAVGAVLYRPTSVTGATPAQRLHVIGVVENAVLQPFTLGASNFYLMNAEAAVVPVIRIAKNEVAAGVASIDDVWSELAADVPLRRRFATEQYEASYGSISIIDDAIGVLGVLATIIAVTGLIGITLHTVRRRTKEIAVRKVTGAGVGEILRMLLVSFLKPVVIANLVVWPFVYIVMTGYLSVFAVRAGLGVAPFIASLAVTLGVATLAVIAQAARAARTSPGVSLRCE